MFTPAKPHEMFEDSIQRMGGTQNAALSDPEKYNLYAGLKNLSLLVEELVERVEDVQSRVKRMGR